MPPSPLKRAFFDNAKAKYITVAFCQGKMKKTCLVFVILRHEGSIDELCMCHN